MNQFDENILQDILRRLPVKTLVQSKRTCKRWNHLISSPFFVKTHAIRSTSAYGLLSITAHRHGVLAYSPIDPGEAPNVTLDSISIKAACDDLIFFESDGIYRIGSPSTNSFYQVPPPITASVNTRFGIAFDAMHPAAVKIVACTRTNFSIYSPRTNTWNVSKRLSHPFSSFVDNVNSVFFNGALHWLQVKGGIVAFNVEEERPYRIKIPDGADPQRISCYSNVWFGVAKGTLTLVRVKDGIHIWEMKDYQSRRWEFKKLVAMCEGEEGHYETSVPLFYDCEKCVLLTWGPRDGGECGLAVYRIAPKRWEQIRRPRGWMDNCRHFVPYICHL